MLPLLLIYFVNLRIMPKENIILSLNIKLERNIVGFKLVFLFVLAVKPKWFGHTPRVLAMPGWMLLLGLKRLCSKVGWLFSLLEQINIMLLLKYKIFWIPIPDLPPTGNWAMPMCPWSERSKNRNRQSFVFVSCLKMWT